MPLRQSTTAVARPAGFPRAVGIVFLLFCGLTVSAAADPAAVEKELARLQGEWRMVSGSADGYEMPEAMRRGFKRVCKGDELTVTSGDQLVMKAEVTIDPSASPKTIDYEVTEGVTKGKKHLGIYELEGDKLKSSFAAPDMPRPADFTSKPGDRRTVSVWEQPKKP